MAVASYGRKVTMKSNFPLFNPESSLQTDESPFYPNDLTSLLEIQLGDDAYLEFLLDHCGLQVEDLLYYCFEGPSLNTTNGAEFHAPPVFILRDTATQSVVVLVRGTHDFNDILIDIYGKAMKWEEGFVHEVFIHCFLHSQGIGMIAKSIATDPQILSTLEEALTKHTDYTLKVVGHSLGASIAALTAIYWQTHHTFHSFEHRGENELFLRCFAFAPPPAISKEVKEKGVGFVYSVVNEDDIVPRLNTVCIYGMLREVFPCLFRSKNRFDSMSIPPIRIPVRIKILRIAKSLGSRLDRFHTTPQPARRRKPSPFCRNRYSRVLISGWFRVLGAVGIWMRSMSRSMAAMFFQDRFICFIPQLQMERSMLSMKRRRMSMSKYSAQSNVLSIVDKVVNIALRSETNPHSSRRDVFFFRAALSSDCPSFSLFHNSPQLCCV